MRRTVFHLVYASAATIPFSKDRLVALLQQSRDKNRRLGITGLLVFRGGWFMQVLEGEKQAVRDIFATIAADKRHRGVIVLEEGEYPRRQFPEWSMGFRDLDDPQLRAMDGFSEFMNNPIAGRRGFDSKGCLALLSLFAARGGPEDTESAPAPDAPPMRLETTRKKLTPAARPRTATRKNRKRGER